MDDYITNFTSRQLQKLLKVDRITIYRMIRDGRLKGVKIGQQWRFPINENETLLLGVLGSIRKPDRGNLPIHCMQAIQNVFAETANVGSVFVNVEGATLTEISNECEFCSLIKAKPFGLKACQESLRQLANTDLKEQDFFTCHAGLQYTRARIEHEGKTIAFLVSGQFYTQVPHSKDEEYRINQLAENYQMDPLQLAHAARGITVLSSHTRLLIHLWTEHVAEAVNSILKERAGLMDRLRKIAEISNIST